YGASASKLQFIKAYDALGVLSDGTPTHWVAIVYAAQVDPKNVKNNEPYKIDEIGWFSFDNLPKDIHSQIIDNAYVLKLLMFAILGLFWIRFVNPTGTTDLPLPFGLFMGLIFAS